MALKMAMRSAAKGGQSIPRQLPLGTKPTPQNKIVNIAEKLGIPGLKKQQGTTRTIYDFLPMVEGLVAETPYAFFKNVKQRQFPFTNLNDNKLDAAEAIAVERIYFAIMSVTTATLATAPEVVDIETFDSASLPAAYMAQWNLKIGSQDYTKDNTLLAFKPEFNHNAKHTTNAVYTPGVFTVIPPDLQFYMNVLMPGITNPSSETLSFFLGVFLEGDASILNMKETL